MSLNPTVRVKAAMNRKMITLDKGLSVKSAIKLMVKKNIGSVVVTADSNHDPVGILTERDILKSIAYRRVRPEVTKIEEIMSTPILSVEQDATLGDAAQMMIKKNIRRLLVKQDNKYVGIITQRDLQKLMTDTIRALLII
jgi:predicted transcriptional regulator